MRRPASLDFSGWNWTPKTWSVSTAAANSAPCAQVATDSGVTGAANECVKYTWLAGLMPSSSRDGRGASSEFHPTWGTFTVAGSREHTPGDGTEPGDARRFVAALEQPLHAEADAEERQPVRRQRS